MASEPRIAIPQAMISTDMTDNANKICLMSAVEPPVSYGTKDNIVTSGNSASLYYAPYFARHVFLPGANLLVAAKLVLAPLTPSKTPVC